MSANIEDLGRVGGPAKRPGIRDWTCFHPLPALRCPIECALPSDSFLEWGGAAALVAARNLWCFQSR
jgi:hypothetical protein